MIPTPILVGEPVQLSRDPFARSITIRRTVRYGPDRSTTAISCRWCGQDGHVSPNRWRRFFQYGSWQDGINTQPSYVDGVFCSVGCFRAYTT